MMNDTFQLNCIGCGTPVEVVKGCIIGGSAMCDECSRKERYYEHKQSMEKILKERWIKKCPPAYVDSCTEKLPDQSRSQAVFKAYKEGKGVNLWGSTRTGKTRTTILLLKREHFRQKSWSWYSPHEFSTQLEIKAYRRGSWLHKMAMLDILAIDDLDKLNLTTEMKKTLFCLLDERIINRRSTFLTHNSTAEQLEKAFWDLGKPLVSRLRESFLNVHFGPVS